MGKKYNKKRPPYKSAKKPAPQVQQQEEQLEVTPAQEQEVMQEAPAQEVVQAPVQEVSPEPAAEVVTEAPAKPLNKNSFKGG